MGKLMDTISGQPRKLDGLQLQLETAIRERDEARKTLEELRPLRCSFCAKTQHEVKKLIAGPTVLICDECVKVCMQILEAPNPEAE